MNKQEFLKNNMFLGKKQFLTALMDHMYPESTVKTYSQNETIDYFRNLKQLKKQAARVNKTKKD